MYNDQSLTEGGGAPVPTSPEKSSSPNFRIYDSIPPYVPPDTQLLHHRSYGSEGVLWELENLRLYPELVPGDPLPDYDQFMGQMFWVLPTLNATVMDVLMENQHRLLAKWRRHVLVFPQSYFLGRGSIIYVAVMYCRGNQWRSSYENMLRICPGSHRAIYLPST